MPKESKNMGYKDGLTGLKSRYPEESGEIVGSIDQEI